MTHDGWWIVSWFSVLLPGGHKKSRPPYLAKDSVNPERERLKQKAIDIHTASRGAAGARRIAGQLTQQGEKRWVVTKRPA